MDRRPLRPGHDATESAESRSLTGRAYGPLDHQSFLTTRSWLFYSWACSYKHSDGVEQRDSPAGRQWQRRGWDDVRKAILYIDKVWYSLTKSLLFFNGNIRYEVSWARKSRLQNMSVCLFSHCGPKPSDQTIGPILIKFAKTYILGQNRYRRGNFEKYLKSIRILSNNLYLFLTL